MALVARALSVLGAEAVAGLAAAVDQIEAGGGRLTTDKTRRRTKGGVFWSLLKEVVTADMYADIFADERQLERERCARRQRARRARGGCCRCGRGLGGGGRGGG